MDPGLTRSFHFIQCEHSPHHPSVGIDPWTLGCHTPQAHGRVHHALRGAGILGVGALAREGGE